MSSRRSAVFERKAAQRDGVGSACEAKRTVWRNSRVAMVETTGSVVETTGSVEESTFIAWTIFWTLFSLNGLVRPRPPACLLAKMKWVLAHVGRWHMLRTVEISSRRYSWRDLWVRSVERKA